jgi:nucleoside-diphosphate-sugar epimerase
LEQQKQKRCLVTGASGAVGGALVEELLRKRHAVRVLIRGKADFARQVEVVRGDLRDAETLKRATDAAEWIFHCAAKLHINNPAPELRDEYQTINVLGTNNLIEAARTSGAEKFVFFSTINVYGTSDEATVFDETSPRRPNGFYAESKAAAEDLILQSNFGVILRFAAVYGRRMKGNYIRLFKALQKNRFFFIGAGTNRRTVIHQRDAARAAVLAAERAAAGAVYNATDGSIHTFAEIVQAMAKAIDKKPPRFHLPLAPIRFGIGFLENAAKTLGIKSPVTLDLLEKLLEDMAVDGTKIQRELGFKPLFDLTEGWRETVCEIHERK